MDLDNTTGGCRQPHQSDSQENQLQQLDLPTELPGLTGDIGVKVGMFLREKKIDTVLFGEKI